MSGHSKWAQIKRQKGTTDARRGQVFTKLGREIQIAARQGGGDPDGNARLRLAVQRAREQNMPMENIDRAIKRAMGQAEGAQLEEAVYEGYGPGGTAVLVEVTTDNRNRTAADLRNAFTRGGGNLGESGCVAWIFELRGVISVPTDGHDPEELALQAIDAGADDVQTEDDAVEIYTESTALDKVRQILEQQKITVATAEPLMIPKTTIALDAETSIKVLRLMERLEDLDDVHKVYTNADFPDDILDKYDGM